MHVSWVFPSVTFLIHPTFPFFLSFFFLFTHRNVSLRTHCRGEERDFPSLIYLFPSSLPLPDHFRLLLSLSLSLSSLLFSPHALPKHLHVLFKPLLVVYWSVIAGSLDVKQERYYCTKTSLLNVIWRPFLYNFLFQGLSKEDVSVFYPSLFLN